MMNNPNIDPLTGFPLCDDGFTPAKVCVTVIDGPNIDKTRLRPKSQYSLFKSINNDNEVEFFDSPADVITRWNNALLKPYEIAYSQFNSEGAIINALNSAYETDHCIILNAAAYTHTSVAIHDCLEYRPIPVIEVHVSNPYEREDFRKRNLISSVTDLHITGGGECAYISALYAVRSVIRHYAMSKQI